MPLYESEIIMALDGLVLYSIIHELAFLTGSAVQKIYQPEKDEIILLLHGKEGNKKLLISVSPSSPRMYVTEENYKNPETAPMFCMLLRKHFTGGKIKSISQNSLDRVSDIAFECHNEMGDTITKHIIVEIMGRNSNLIITDENFKIYDCIRKNDIFSENTRTILPGFTYTFPEITDKFNLLEMTEDEVKRLCKENENKSLYKLFTGFSPLAEREAEHSKDITVYLLDLRKKLLDKEFCPTVVYDGDSPVDFWCFDIKEYGNLSFKTFSNMSRAMEEYYFEKAHLEHMKQKNASLTKLISNLLSRAERKLKLQLKELTDAGKKDEFKIMGDLITANLYKLKGGEKIVEVSDWSKGFEEILHIPLDESITPSENAQRYYKKYAKAKNAEVIIKKQIKITIDEIEYLKSVLLSVNNADNSEDIEQIKEELSEAGYINNIKDKKKKMSASKPLLFEYQGFKIYVGKNNKQNDMLTLKQSGAKDMWLHVKNNAGSHVVIESNGKEIPSEVIEYAAKLAAKHSKANGAPKTEVDYTLIKFVKKPPGSKPGMVIYTDYKTCII